VSGIGSGDDRSVTAQSTEEKVVVHCITWSFAYYLVGGLYVLGPVLGWLLLLHVARRDGLRDVPGVMWAWVVGMLVMLVAVVVAHADYRMGLGATIKSCIGWAKGWALMAVFILIGSGNIRIEVLSRALCILGVQILCLLPVLALAWVVGLPGHLYVSPLSIVGGPGPEYFAVELYGLNAQTGLPRWRLFAPWAPAMGLLMSCFVLVAMHEQQRVLRAAGILGMLIAIYASGSRLGLIALPLVAVVLLIWKHLDRPVLYLGLAPVALLAGVFATALQTLLEDFTERFHGARADSSRVRAALNRIAVQRWETEAYWWGHGNVERGPHLVEHMPIGSHHTWFGLLFVKGAVGALALAVPMAWTAWTLLTRGRTSKAGVSAFGILMILGLYSLSENLEMLAYLYWPALVVLGMGLRDVARSRRSAISSPPADRPVHLPASPVTP
jgi:hypothetical protein